jgi:hypothetical protein
VVRGSCDPQVARTRAVRVRGAGVRVTERARGVFTVDGVMTAVPTRLESAA